MAFKKELFKDLKPDEIDSYLKQGVVNYVDINNLYKDSSNGELILVMSPNSNVITSDKDLSQGSKTTHIDSGDGSYHEIQLVPILIFTDVVCIIVDKLSKVQKSKILDRYNSVYWGNISNCEVRKVDTYIIGELPINRLTPKGFEFYTKYLEVNEQYELLIELKGWDPLNKREEDTIDNIEKYTSSSTAKVRINGFYMLTTDGSRFIDNDEDQKEDK